MFGDRMAEDMRMQYEEEHGNFGTAEATNTVYYEAEDQHEGGMALAAVPRRTAAAGSHTPALSPAT